MLNIQQKLEQMQTILTECLLELDSSKNEAPFPKKQKSKIGSSNIEVNIIDIINKIKNCSEQDKIEKNILDKVSAEGRILLPFYVCCKYFPSRLLTTGEIEKITADLGVKVRQPNVAKTIKGGLHKYLDSNKTRVKGVKTPYKLNRKGLKYFELILDKKYE